MTPEQIRQACVVWNAEPKALSDAGQHTIYTAALAYADDLEYRQSDELRQAIYDAIYESDDGDYPDGYPDVRKAADRIIALFDRASDKEEA